MHRAGLGGTSASFYLFNSSNVTVGTFEVQSTHQSARLLMNNTASTQTLDLDLDGFVAKTTITFDGDTNIYRNAANTLKTDDTMVVAGDFYAEGTIYFGAAADTNLYRSAANTLKTDDDFIATSLAGTGASITTLNATNISSGTLANARLPSAISVTSVTASGEIRGATARFGSFTGSADVAITGSVSITDDGGTSRKLATIA